ncbi:MAG: DSD1 family PLP-dependent enzyme [candidate division NC10 bacterium]|nr:DSD1 family PLP-dependent enzyme [candidate division NC10 bacterium]
MSTRPPAEVGMHLDDVDTPALLLDLDAFERNVAGLAQAVAGIGAGLRLRPHAKSHKCPVIALRQMAQGAVGVCCQKVSEAEAMVYGGVPDVLVSNEIVGTAKIARLVALAKQARVTVCADDAGNVATLSEAAATFGVRLPVLVEVNVGSDRCGVEPGEPPLALARQIAASPGLRFAGLQAYYGAAQHIREYAKRKEAIDAAAEKVRRTLDLLHQHELACEVISGAGTGTYTFEAGSGIWNELQAGSYIFMDADYLKNLKADGTPGGDFEPSLFVYATVMSRPTKDRAILDAGLKALSVDVGFPWVVGMQDVEYIRAADEHGRLTLHDPDRTLPLGQKLRLVPGHCDPTVNLHDWYVCYRNNRVEALWPITARGAVL